MSAPLRAFEGYGIELEYMIVDRERLSVRPLADEWLCEGGGDASPCRTRSLAAGFLAGAGPSRSPLRRTTPSRPRHRREAAGRRHGVRRHPLGVRRPCVTGEQIRKVTTWNAWVGANASIGSAGTLYAKNITPAALGEWTDGEIIRALRDGVSRDGTALFPLMPYFNFRRLSEFDIHAIVAYTRTLAPRDSEVPPRDLAFPMNLIVRLMPGPAGLYPSTPDASNTVAYGEYLVTAASCGDCHSPMDDRGRPLPGRELSGGNPFPTGDGWVAHTANITPDSETGIGTWTRERFVSNVRQRAAAAGSPLSEIARLTPMPWIAFAGMTDEDLGAVYDYLRTVPPVRNEVTRFTREGAGSPE